jgi:hypothetical protein
LLLIVTLVPILSNNYTEQYFL